MISTQSVPVLLERREVRFVLVGGTAAGTYALLAGSLTTLWPEHRFLVGLALCITIAPFAFVAQRAYVFRSEGAPGPEFLRYLGLQIGCITVSLLILPRFANHDPVWNMMIYGGTAALSAAVSFIVCAVFVFGKRRLATAAPLSSARSA